MNQSLTALATPLPKYTKAQSWHTQSELVTSWAQLPIVERDARLTTTLARHLWLLGHNLAVFPDVNRRTVHARHFPGSAGSTPHSTTDTGSKALRFLRRLTSSCHGPRSTNLGFGFGIFIYCPMIRQGLMHIEEIGPPAPESSYHIGSRDIMAALPHSARDPTQRELRRSEPNVDNFDQITPALPILETLRVVQAAQRTLEREFGPRFGQAVKFSEDHAASRYGCKLRAQRRNSTGN